MKLALWMRIFLVVTPSFAAPNVWAMPGRDSAGARAQVLFQEVQREGLTRVSQRQDLTELDKVLLRIMADVTEDPKALQILGPRPPMPASKFLLSSDPKVPRTMEDMLFAHDALSDLYTVRFTNLADETLPEVVLMYQLRNGALSPPLTALGLTPENHHTFLLGACPNMWRYAIAVLDEQHHVLVKLPASGNMTPEMASQLNSADREPCADSWTLHAQTVP